MNYKTDLIKYQNPLLPVLLRYGVEPDNKGFAHCPFHNEKTASFKVFDNNSYYCFGCGEHGDVIDFIRKIENLSFEDACARLTGEVRYSDLRKADKIAQHREKKKNTKNEMSVAFWEAFDLWLLNEWIIADTKPNSPSDEPSRHFLAALNRRGLLEHRLDIAQMNYVKGV